MVINSKPSSLVQAIQYDPETKDLTVSLIGNKKFTYPNVTADEHNRFVSAPSHGQHFSKFIRNKEYRK